MTTWRKVCCCLIAAAAAFGAFADGESEIREGQLWTYNKSNGWLTEIVETGVTPWKFYVSASGQISSKSSGANTTVDLRTAALPTNMPAITWISDIRGDSKCETLHLPDTLLKLTSHTFYNWTALKHVTFPQNPGGNFTAGADGTGGTFYGTKVQEAVLPRTMTAITGYMFNGVGGNLKRVVLPDDVVSIDTGFNGCSGINEIEWRNWVTNVMNKTQQPFGSVGALNCRHIVPGNNPDWARFFWDPAKVTPWAKCTASEQSTYFTRYGEDAAVPFGISVSGAAGFNRGYIVTDGTSCGVPFSATVADARTGSITLDPALPDSGFYPEDTQIRVTFTPAAGSSFVHWEGTTDGVDVDAAEITVTANRLYALVAIACSSSYSLDGGTLTDGYTTLSCSGESDALVITGVVSAPGTIDLSKPVTGGTIVGIGASAFGSAKGLTRVILPVTVAEIGSKAFPAAVTEVVWTGSPATWAGDSFSSFTAKKTRFLVPADNADWAAVVCDAAKVTPWPKVDAADKAAYSTGFGADAAEPVGLGVGGGLSGVWIVPQSANGLKVAALPRQLLGARPTPAVTTADGEPVADVEYAYVNNDVPGLAAVVATVTAGEYEGEKAVGYYMVATVSHSDTYTWKATASGNWEDAANWQSASGDAGYPQMPDDIVVLPLTTDDTTVTVTVNDPFAIASLSVGSQEGQMLAGKIVLEFKSGLAVNEVSGDVAVLKNATLTHFGPNDTLTHRLALKVGGDLSVEQGGQIYVGASGYSNGKGPGAARDRGTHAGEVNMSNSWGSEKQYGSIREPLEYGSGASYVGIQGAGSILMEVAGEVAVAGGASINADAKDGGNVCGGAGGSIFIRCGKLTGVGTLTAHGGIGGGYGGSGGRIAVYQSAANDFTAFTGTLTTGHASNGDATGGTIYLETPADKPGEGTLLIDNAGANTGYMVPLKPGVIGYDETFGSVVLRNRGKLRVSPGTTLKVTKSISVAANCLIQTDAGGVIEFVDPTVEATVTGGSLIAIDTLVCTNAGKTIRFGTAAADKITINAGKNFIMKGAEGNPVSLLSTADGTPWQIAMNPNPGVSEVKYVAVKDSNAASGSPMLAISSQNLGNNTNWGFSNPIVPGETITWTGGMSTKWDAVENWDLGRAPVETDVIAIPSVGTGNYPVLPAGTYAFNRINVGAGASLTWKGCTVTITNDLVVAGTLAFTAGEQLSVEGNVTVTGGVTPATGTIYVTGAGDQTLDFGDTTLFKIEFDKPSGDVSFGAHGFTATQFNCQATTGIAFTFAAGCTYAIPQFLVNGLSGEDRLVTLRSSEPGMKWLLVTTAAGQNVAGVTVSDSDATGGDVVYGGTMSRETDCLGWDCVSDVASWLGGSGDFTDPSKWSSGNVPGPDTLVTISAGDGVTLTATLPAGSPLTVKQLVVYAGTGGKATFKADSPLTVREDVTIRSGGVLELNAHDDYGEAPNVVTGSVTIASGGVLSHSGPATTEASKLHLKVLGAMTVDAGGSVSVVGKGYPFVSNSKAYGPGAGRDNGRHGGYTDTAYSTGICYGSIRNPTNFGSSVWWVGMNSPGAIHLVVPGTLTVNGSIAANGEGGNVCGSSGGSVWVECGTLAGAGSITANGGPCGQYSGSGGRVAVCATACDPAQSGVAIAARCPSGWAACGTVYLESPDDEPGEGTLIIDNTGNSADYKTPLNATIQGSSEPFGRVKVSGYGRLVVEAGTVLKVVKGLELTSTGYLTMAADAAVEFVGEDEAVLTGAKNATFSALVCTNVAKTIRFGTTAQDLLTIPAGAQMLLSGSDAEHPLVLEPSSDDPAATWQLNVHADAVQDVKYVAVSNSNASAGTSILAIDSQDRGGNSYWSFTSPIHPDDPIRWTGAVSTDWADGANWDLKRAPVLTDKVYVDAVGEGGNHPVMANGTFVQNKIYVGEGATLTLSASALTVSNEFEMAGSLVFTGTETLHLVGNADFTGGAVTAAGSFVFVEGETVQSIDLGDCVFRSVEVAKGGGAAVFAGGFKADILRCVPTVQTELRFADGVMIDVKNPTLLGGSAKLLTLAGNAAGDVWRLKATADGQAVAGVVVSGCDASSGATVYAGTTSEDAGGNVNWDFVENRGIWVGGDGSFMEPSNWATGVLPGPGDAVIVSAAEGGTMKVTIPSGPAVAIGSLRIAAGTGGKATFVANAPLGVAGDVSVCANSVLELNCYDNAGAAPNTVGGDMTVFAGGTVTHKGPNGTENAKVHLAVAGDLTIESGGAVDVTGKGHSDSTGKGRGGGYIAAAHAGYGYGGALPYGSILHPFDWGSATQSSIGGGAIRLEVAGTLSLNGNILADAGGGGTYSSAGGSVWIDCARLEGSGLVAARDGLAGAWDNKYASSGGRIAIYQRVAKDFAAFPLAQMKASYRGGNAAGTIYLESADKSKGGYLYVNGGASAPAQCTLVPMADDGDLLKSLRNVNLVIGPNAWVEVSSKARVCFRDLDLQASSSKLNVNGATVQVRSLRHKDGKRWYKPLADEIADGKVVLGGTALNPGRIEWVGGVDGTVLIVK